MEEKRKPGRPTGSKSQDSLGYQEYWVKQKICIPELEKWVLQEAKERFLYYKGKLDGGRVSPLEDRSAEFLKIYKDQLREIANRIYPKLKSIDNSVTADSVMKMIVDDYMNKPVGGD